jgi:hypothetical protein
MNIVTTLIVFRLTIAAIFAGGAIYLAIDGKDGWGWFVFAALVLGAITVEGVNE